MPKLTSEELLTVIEHLYPTLEQERRDQVRQLIRTLDESEYENLEEDTNIEQRTLEWKAALRALDQFIQDNITEEHYQYITDNIVQRRTLQQCLEILTIARPLLLTSINGQVENLICNLGRARYRLNNPNEYSDSVLIQTRIIYVSDLVTLRNITGLVIERTSQ
jgi:hypothetical protein